jgi:hypothetical protein
MKLKIETELIPPWVLNNPIYVETTEGHHDFPNGRFYNLDHLARVLCQMETLAIHKHKGLVLLKNIDTFYLVGSLERGYSLVKRLKESFSKPYATVKFRPKP